MADDASADDCGRSFEITVVGARGLRSASGECCKSAQADCKINLRQVGESEQEDIALDATGQGPCPDPEWNHSFQCGGLEQGDAIEFEVRVQRDGEICVWRSQVSVSDGPLHIDGSLALNGPFISNGKAPKIIVRISEISVASRVSTTNVLDSKPVGLRRVSVYTKGSRASNLSAKTKKSAVSATRLRAKSAVRESSQIQISEQRTEQLTLRPRSSAKTNGSAVVHGLSGASDTTKLSQMAEVLDTGASWQKLGNAGGGTVFGKTWSAKECFERAVSLDPSNKEAQKELATEAGMSHKTVKSQNKSNCRFWNKLGVEGGGVVNDVQYNSKECFEKALEFDAFSSLTWVNLGIVGGGCVQGVDYDQRQSYVRALEMDPNSKQAWNNLGSCGGVAFNGSEYDPKMCYETALSSDQFYTDAWVNLGAVGGGTVLGYSFDPCQCYAKAAELDPACAAAWNTLGTLLSNDDELDLDGQIYTKKECFAKALACSQADGRAWSNFGDVGGGELPGGQIYEPRECYLKAVSLSPCLARAWGNLGIFGDAEVDGENYTAVECLSKSIDADPSHARVWNNFGVLGGGNHKGSFVEQAVCFARAIELGLEGSKGWFNLGVVGGGDVQGQFFTKTDCYARALEIDPNDATIWNNLGSVGGGSVDGVTYTDLQCFEKALEYDQEDALVWRNLGCARLCHGGDHASKECFEVAIGLQKADTCSWANLAALGGGTVDGTHYDRRFCWNRVIEGSPDDATAWNNLGACGGGSTEDGRYDAEDCFLRALEIDADNAIAAENLQQLRDAVVEERRRRSTAMPGPVKVDSTPLFDPVKRVSYKGLGGDESDHDSDSSVDNYHDFSRFATEILAPGADRENLPECAAISFKITGAKHLRPTSHAELVNAYVVCLVPSQDDPLFTSEVCANCADPVWEEVYSFQGFTTTTVVTFQVWDYRPDGVDEFLGSSNFLLDPEETFQGSLELENALVFGASLQICVNESQDRDMPIGPQMTLDNLVAYVELAEHSGRILDGEDHMKKLLQVESKNTGKTMKTDKSSKTGAGVASPKSEHEAKSTKTGKTTKTAHFENTSTSTIAQSPKAAKSGTPVIVEPSSSPSSSRPSVGLDSRKPSVNLDDPSVVRNATVATKVSEAKSNATVVSNREKGEFKEFGSRCSPKAAETAQTNKEPESAQRNDSVSGKLSGMAPFFTAQSKKKSVVTVKSQVTATRAVINKPSQGKATQVKTTGMEDLVENEVTEKSRRKAMETALENNMRSARAWNNLGVVGGGSIQGKHYAPGDCFVQALEIEKDNPQAWNNLGVHGGVTFNGQFYTNRMCFEQALSSSERYAKAWMNLGTTGGGDVNDVHYSPIRCFAKCSELDPSYGQAWNNLGTMLKPSDEVEVDGAKYSKKECFVKALQCNPRDSKAWNNVGDMGGCKLNEVEYTQEQCYRTALDIDPRLARAWCSAGTFGDQELKAERVSQKDCFLRALQFGDVRHQPWNNLGVVGGGEVGGKMHTPEDCFEKSLEISADAVSAWFNLGRLGGGKINGRLYGRSECYVKVIEKDPVDRDAWNNLGVHGGGYISGTPYNDTECFQKGLEIDPEFAIAWKNLGLTGGGHVAGDYFSPKECYERVLEKTDDTVAWGCLGFVGGGVVKGTNYDKRWCWLRVIENDPKDSIAWNNLGAVGGGSVGGLRYDVGDCFRKALEIDSQNEIAKQNLECVSRQEKTATPKEDTPQTSSPNVPSTDGEVQHYNSLLNDLLNDHVVDASSQPSRKSEQVCGTMNPSASHNSNQVGKQTTGHTSARAPCDQEARENASPQVSERSAPASASQSHQNSARNARSINVSERACPVECDSVSPDSTRQVSERAASVASASQSPQNSACTTRSIGASERASPVERVSVSPNSVSPDSKQVSERAASVASASQSRQKSARSIGVSERACPVACGSVSGLDSKQVSERATSVASASQSRQNSARSIGASERACPVASGPVSGMDSKQVSERATSVVSASQSRQNSARSIGASERACPDASVSVSGLESKQVSERATSAASVSEWRNGISAPVDLGDSKSERSCRSNHVDTVDEVGRTASQSASVTKYESARADVSGHLKPEVADLSTIQNWPTCSSFSEPNGSQITAVSESVRLEPCASMAISESVCVEASERVLPHISEEPDNLKRRGTAKSARSSKTGASSGKRQAWPVSVLEAAQESKTAPSTFDDEESLDGVCLSIISATGLVPVRRKDECAHCYIICKAEGVDGPPLFQTQVYHDSNDPEWEEDYCLQGITDPVNLLLEFWDYYPDAPDELLASTTFPLSPDAVYEGPLELFGVCGQLISLDLRVNEPDVEVCPSTSFVSESPSYAILTPTPSCKTNRS